MAMCSSYDIGVDVFHVGLYFVSNIVDRFEGSFATYWRYLGLLEYGVLVIDITSHVRWR